MMALTMMTAFTTTPAGAEPMLGSPFGNGMVLQRDMSIPVWGWATPGEAISVAFKGQKKETIAAEDGRWRVALDPMEADAAPATLHVAASLAPQPAKLFSQKRSYPRNPFKDSFSPSPPGHASQCR